MLTINTIYTISEYSISAAETDRICRACPHRTGIDRMWTCVPTKYLILTTGVACLGHCVRNTFKVLNAYIHRSLTQYYYYWQSSRLIKHSGAIYSSDRRTNNLYSNSLMIPLKLKVFHSFVLLRYLEMKYSPERSPILLQFSSIIYDSSPLPQHLSNDPYLAIFTLLLQFSVLSGNRRFQTDVWLP